MLFSARPSGRTSEVVEQPLEGDRLGVNLTEDGQDDSGGGFQAFVSPL